MKTNFSSKLFDKKIELDACNSINGGGSGCSTITFSYPENESADSTTTYYNEEGEVYKIKECGIQ